MSEPRGYCDWEVGDRVVCIRDFEWYGRDAGLPYPRLGEVVTVRLIEIIDADVYLRFVEYPRIVGGDLSFLHTYFRRVYPSQKSIDALAALTDKPDPKLVEHIPVREAIEQ